MQKIIEYIISFLVGEEYKKYISYSNEFKSDAKITIIRSNFFDEEIYGTQKTIPIIPFRKIDNTDIPFLYGQSIIEKKGNSIVIYADLVASTYFFFSRYEEIINTQRDKFGRFRAEYSLIYQQGYGFEPLVDIWGNFLRTQLRMLGVEVPAEKKGFNKVFLTHDIDYPFRYTSLKYALIQPFKQIIKKVIRKGDYKSGIFSYSKGYINYQKDPYFTFPFFVELDGKVRNNLGDNVVIPLYFIISAGNKVSNQYCSIRIPKYRKLVKYLVENNSKFGLHISFEAGENPERIEKELSSLPKVCFNYPLKSRHHFLRWREPEHIVQMEKAGIKEDYTLGYADTIGFRCGTTKSFLFINPRTLQLSSVEVFPLQIMEGTLYGDDYMNLNYEKSFECCKLIIDKVYQFNGNLNILFHNSNMTDEFFNKKLYTNLCEYIISLSRG